MQRTKLTYQEQIQRAFRKAAKGTKFGLPGDEAAMQYYAEASCGVACVSFETFKGSWAGELWLKRHGFVT